MKTIKLKKLTLQDWRGQNKEVNFGNVTEIKGRNESGKSTIFNAFLWLLMGVDCNDNSNFKLFDERVEPTHENSKVASVEGLISIDGIDYTFKRTAEMGWTRKRGSEVYERKGTDNYRFYIDSIERNATDYRVFVEDNFAPYDKLKLMLNIRHFLTLDWKELRRVFQDMVGEIRTEDFKGDYNMIANELAKYTTEQIKESIRSQMKPIKANIEGLPVTISTIQSSLPDISNLDEVQKDIDEAKEQIEKIDRMILGNSEQTKVYIEKRNAELSEVNKLKQEYAEAESAYNLKPIEDANKIKIQIAEIDSANAQITRENKSAKETIENAEKSLKLATSKLYKLTEYRKTLLKQNDEVKAMEFKNGKCSFCGQELPEDMLESAKKTFFEQRDAKHKAIVAEGKANNEKISQCNKEIEELQAVIGKGYVEKPLQDKGRLTLELDNLHNNFVKYCNTKDGKEKLAKISEAEANLTEIPTTDTTALQNMKKELLNEIERNSKKLGLKDTYDKQFAKIVQYQSELKDSASELARLEGKLNAVERYEREKASIISYKVNSKFDYLKVEMMEINKSGNIVDTCRVLDNKGVSANVTNTASRVLIGIDLSATLQKFYDLCLPIFVDEAHTIDEDNYPKIENQIIKMWNNGGDFNVESK